MWMYLLISALSFNVGACYLFQPSIYYQQSLYYPAPAYRPNYFKYNYGCCWYPPIVYNRYYTHQLPYRSSYDQTYTYPVYQSAFYVPLYNSFPIPKRPALITAATRPLLISTTFRPVLKSTASRPVLTSTTSRSVLTTTYTTPPTPPTSPTFLPRVTNIPTSTHIPEEITTEKEEDHDNGSGGFPTDDEDLVFPQ